MAPVSKKQAESSGISGCPECNGSGWVRVVKDGAEGVQRCDCYRHARIERLVANARIPSRYVHCELTSFETSEKPNDAELFGAKLSHVCVTLSSSKRFLCGGPKRPNRVDENIAAQRNAIQFRWLATGRARSDGGITSIITCHKCRGSAQWLLL